MDWEASVAPPRHIRNGCDASTTTTMTVIPSIASSVAATTAPIAAATTPKTREEELAEWRRRRQQQQTKSSSSSRTPQQRTPLQSLGTNHSSAGGTSQRRVRNGGTSPAPSASHSKNHSTGGSKRHRGAVARPISAASSQQGRPSIDLQLFKNPPLLSQKHRRLSAASAAVSPLLRTPRNIVLSNQNNEVVSPLTPEDDDDSVASSSASVISRRKHHRMSFDFSVSKSAPATPLTNEAIQHRDTSNSDRSGNNSESISSLALCAESGSKEEGSHQRLERSTREEEKRALTRQTKERASLSKGRAAIQIQLPSLGSVRRRASSRSNETTPPSSSTAGHKLTSDEKAMDSTTFMGTPETEPEHLPLSSQSQHHNKPQYTAPSKTPGSARKPRTAVHRMTLCSDDGEEDDDDGSPMDTRLVLDDLELSPELDKVVSNPPRLRAAGRPQRRGLILLPIPSLRRELDARAGGSTESQKQESQTPASTSPASTSSSSSQVISVSPESLDPHPTRSSTTSEPELLLLDASNDSCSTDGALEDRRSRRKRTDANAILLPIPSIRQQQEPIADDNTPAKSFASTPSLPSPASSVEDPIDPVVDEVVVGEASVELPSELKARQCTRSSSPQVSKTPSVLTSPPATNHHHVFRSEMRLPVVEEEPDRYSDLREQLRVAQAENRRLQSLPRKTYDDRVEPFREAFEVTRQLRSDNQVLRTKVVQLEQEKQQMEELIAGIQKQAVEAIEMALQKKTELDLVQSELDRIKSKPR